MLIKIFIILSSAYYILRFFKPDFYGEMLLEDILERNKECGSLEDLKIKSIAKNSWGDMIRIISIIFFCTIHMWTELIIVIILAFKYKSVAATIYLVFWLLIYAKRRIDARKVKNDKFELIKIRDSLTVCYKIRERMIVLVDSTFFIYMFISTILGGII